MIKFLRSCFQVFFVVFYTILFMPMRIWGHNLVVVGDSSTLQHDEVTLYWISDVDSVRWKARIPDDVAHVYVFIL